MTIHAEPPRSSLGPARAASQWEPAVEGAERMVGGDAVFLHSETPDTPFHTLKVMVLDPAYRGRDLSLDEMIEVLPRYLGLVPRSTQKVVSGPGFEHRPFWVEDPDFDVVQHLDERWLPAPGDRAELDALCAELATQQLDRSRPLWALTLVHGLAGGRQAVVARVHHAIMDGIAAINAFTAATAPEPSTPIAAAPAPRASHLLPDDLVALARNGQVRATERARLIGRAFTETRRATQAFGSLIEVPRGLTWRSSLNTPSRGDRVCASTSFEIDALKGLARATGVTLNGALHAVLAEALRAELQERGEPTDQPLVAIFGVAEDKSPTRTHGNSIATARAYLRVDLPSASQRLHATARSCLLAVDLRRRRGFALTRATADITARLLPAVRNRAARVTPWVLNHVTTANVPGPDHLRWLGDLAVVDWISFAVAVAPADLNVTAYSYDGRMTVGLVSTPESMPNPAGFLARLRPALDTLLASTGQVSANPA